MKVGWVDLVVCILAVVMGVEFECLVCIERIETRFWDRFLEMVF